MMVREQGDDLHLLSVVSPEWVKPSDTISVRRAPTNFGEVNFALRSTTTGANLDLEGNLRGAAVTFESGKNRYDVPNLLAPKRLILHLPWFMQTTKVVADGKPLQIDQNEVILPVNARQVEISWTKKPGAPQMSYATAVSDYKAEYRRRYNDWLRMGQTTR